MYAASDALHSYLIMLLVVDKYNRLVDTRVLTNRAVGNRVVDDRVLVCRVVDNRAVDTRMVANRAVDNSMADNRVLQLQWPNH